VNSKANILVPFREYMAEYFAYVLEEREESPATEYSHRPLIGLRLELEGLKRLAIRPDWTPPIKRKRYDDRGPFQGWNIITPGSIDPNIITVELLTPGKALSLKLDGTPVKLAGKVFVNQDLNRDNLKLISDAAHALLMNPFARFAQQEEHCCCCGKSLSDVVSRTRGIGPECIKYFRFFDTARFPSRSTASSTVALTTPGKPFRRATPMDEQRWFNREHVIRTRHGIDLRSAIEPMSGNAWFGNKDTKGEKTARLTLYFNEASCGDIFGDNYIFEGVPISSLMDFYTTLAEFFKRPAIKAEVERILALRKLDRLEEDLKALNEQVHQQ
jgi:hypothetical protein